MTILFALICFGIALCIVGATMVPNKLGYVVIIFTVLGIVIAMLGLPNWDRDRNGFLFPPSLTRIV